MKMFDITRSTKENPGDRSTTRTVRVTVFGWYLEVAIVRPWGRNRG